jgi:hypothetical protein
MTEGTARATDVLLRYSRELATRIVESVGEGAVTAIFAGGSLATGAVAWYQGDALEILSDVDLYVVASEGRRNDVRRAVETARSLEPEAGVLLLRGMDIGVFSLGQLLTEPARPGTVHLRESHALLYGDGSVVEKMAATVGNRIDPREGLYLIENRLLEMPDAEDCARDASHQRLCRYQLVKTVFDVTTAYLVGVGRYRGSGEGIAALAMEGALPPHWDEGLVREAYDARADLQSYLAEERDDADLRARRARVARFGVDTWMSVAKAVYPGVGHDPSSLLSRRCSAGHYTDNFREFMRVCRVLGRQRFRMAWTGIRLARYSAVSVLRLSALVGVVDEADGEDLWRYLQRLTHAFGFSEGPLSDRARSMQRAAQSG